MIKIVNYKKRVIYLIFIISIFRLIIANCFELGNDESYYWVYSQYLQWNYFDHPPMVAIWLRIFTGNLLLQNHLLFLRLGSVVSAAFSSWFMYKCVAEISTQKSAWIAVCLYNASFYAGVTAGIFVMPDAPQMVFWTFSMWMITKITHEVQNWKWWILLGTSLGLCVMSKVHGVYLWGGIGLYILFFKQKLLKNPRLYVAILISLVILSPIIIWNIQNDFVTYRFHSERIIIHGYVFNINNFLVECLGEFLVNNPINIILIITALIFKNKIKEIGFGAIRVFTLAGISLIIVVLFLALFRDTRPIWSGPGFISLIPFTAIWLDQNEINLLKYLRKTTLVIYLLGILLLLYFINNIHGTTGSKKPGILGKGDITLDMYGWEKAGKSFDSLYTTAINKGEIAKGTPLVCNTWWGAHEEYYFCRPLKIEMIGLGSMMDLHQYLWTNKKRQALVNMNSAYCIVHSDENFNVLTSFGAYYNNLDTIQTIPIMRKNVISHYFYIIKLSGWKNKIPVAY